MKKSTELILIPCVGRGHLAPALEFAKLVVGRDDRLSMTVLVMKLPLDRGLAAYTDSLIASFVQSQQRIKFVLIESAATASAEETTNPIVYFNQFVDSQKLRVKNAVDELLNSGNTRLAGFVVDMMCTPMADVADDFGVPTYVFWTCGAGFLSLKLHLRQLLDDTDNTIVKCHSNALDIPGFVKPVPAHALPALFDNGSASVVFDIMARIKKAKGVVLNTLAELEPHAVRSLTLSDCRSPSVFPVGPVLNLTGDCGSHAFSSCYSDSVNIMEWLNGQPPSSVVFLCFGSLGSFGGDQVREIALALERTGFRFLWTLRQSPPKDKIAFTSDVCAGPTAVLPEGFLDRTFGVGRVISWAPQVAVLSHPAVGGFVSHCGWNSLLESLWFGVPVAAWPLFAEQQLNAFEMVTELGLAVEIKTDYRLGFDTGIDDDKAVLVSAEEIEAGMRKVMEGDSEVRKRVKEMSEKCRKAVMEGGSSYSSLGCFASDVFENFNFN